MLLRCCQAMFSMGEWEHALVYFHRVERLSRGTSRSAGIGVQRCLEAINKAVTQIQLQQPAQVLTEQRWTKPLNLACSGCRKHR